MENFSFVALCVALLFGAMYIVTFLAWDKVLRLSGSESRKKDGTIIAAFVFLILLVLGVCLPKYMWCIVPTSVVLLSSSLRITFAKEWTSKQVDE